MQLKRSLTPVTVQRLQENLRAGFHDKESRSLPGRKCYEVRPWRRHRARGLHGIPQRLEAAL